MTDTPVKHLTEEPQAERGAPGSRDTGSDEPNAGPADRNTAMSDKGSASSVDPQDSSSVSPIYLPPA